MDDRRRGIKLVEMMVIIFIIGVTLGLFLPAITSDRGLGCRRPNCQNNLRNIGLALVQFSTVKNRFPNAGTFFDDPKIHGGDPAKSNIYRAIVKPESFTASVNPCLSNWVVEILPYLDQQELYNAIDRQDSYLSTTPHGPTVPSNLQITSTSISILRCPDDPTAQPGQGNLSYVVNGGFARWYPIPVGWVGGTKDGKSQNGGVLHWADDGEQRVSIGRRLGVMFLGTQTGDQPWDIKSTPADITDGVSMTLMVGDNTLAGYSKGTPYSGGLPTNWACPLPNFSMFIGSDDVCRSKSSETDCLAGPLKPGPRGQTGDGWAWANHRGSFERINYGSRLTVEGSFPFINGNHPGGTSFVFCDGSVKYLSDSIDGKVFARIITPAGEALPPAIRQGKITQDEVYP